MSDFDFELDFDGETLKATETMEAAIRRFTATIRAAQDDAVKAQLVAMGWTPPGEDAQHVIPHALALDRERIAQRLDDIAEGWEETSPPFPRWLKKLQDKGRRDGAIHMSEVAPVIRRTADEIRRGNHHERNPNE